MPPPKAIAAVANQALRARPAVARARLARLSAVKDANAAIRIDSVTRTLSCVPVMIMALQLEAGHREDGEGSCETRAKNVDPGSTRRGVYGLGSTSGIVPSSAMPAAKPALSSEPSARCASDNPAEGRFWRSRKRVNPATVMPPKKATTCAGTDPAFFRDFIETASTGLPKPAPTPHAFARPTCAPCRSGCNVASIKSPS